MSIGVQLLSYGKMHQEMCKMLNRLHEILVSLLTYVLANQMRICTRLMEECLAKQHGKAAKPGLAAGNIP